MLPSNNMYISRNQYYYFYYKNKKHEYQERYARMKRWEKEKEEMFKPYGGEREYYRNLYAKYCNNNLSPDNNDKCETPIQHPVQAAEGKSKLKGRNKQANKDTSKDS